MSFISPISCICIKVTYYCFPNHYYTSAGGVVMFSRSLRLYKRQGIRVNVLCPEVRVIFEEWTFLVILLIFNLWKLILEPVCF